jgi:hypothetical protein
VKSGRENIFKLKNGNEFLHEDSNDNGVRVGSFATSKNLIGGNVINQKSSCYEYNVSALKHSEIHLDLSWWKNSQLDQSRIQR